MRCELKGLNSKKKVKEELNKNTAKKTVENGKKREKKVYDLPGQKRDPPEEVSSLTHSVGSYSPLVLIN